MVENYKRKFYSILQSIKNLFFSLLIYYNDNISKAKWKFYREIYDMKENIKSDKTIWTKEKYYENISILEDLIFNEYKNDDEKIDIYIKIINEMKNI